MHNTVVFVKNKIESCVLPEYPGIYIYEYAPQAGKYNRPFIGIQYKGFSPSTIQRTIGSTPTEHTIDVYIGAEATDVPSSEDWLAGIVNKIKDCFTPWKIEGNLMVLEVNADLDAENISRLRDTAIVRIKILELT